VAVLIAGRVLHQVRTGGSACEIKLCGFVLHRIDYGCDATSSPLQIAVMSRGCTTLHCKARQHRE
jgi:hypothetical protein